MVFIRVFPLNTVARRCATAHASLFQTNSVGKTLVPFSHREFSSQGPGKPVDDHLAVAISKDKQTYLHEDGGYRLTGLPNNGRLMVGLNDKPHTMYECLREGAAKSSHGELLGRKAESVQGTVQYEWITYNEVIKRTEDIAAAFLKLGIKPGQDTRIGIFSINRPEWFMVAQATYVYNMVNVPVYATFGPDECEFIIKQTQMPLIVCDVQAKAKALLEHGKVLSKHLKHIVIMDVFDVVLRDIGKEHGINVISFAELELLGHDLTSRPPATPPILNDLATICYTSGTTGTPKGVMISHGNMSAVMSVSNMYPEKIGDDCVYLSYMPSAHMFERISSMMMVLSGGRVGYYCGNTQLLVDDMTCLKPTHLITVPRIFNKVYSKVYDSVKQSPIKYAIFNMAVAYKTCLLNAGKIRNNTWADRLVFDKIRVGVFGGNVKSIIIGSAPLGGEVLSFFRAALGCTIREGYGQTESTAAGTLTLDGDYSIGHVGATCTAAEIKIIDVPKMDYKADENGGEILIRGPIVTKGYFLDPKLTAEAFDKDGWLHTGDIGKFNETGALQLVDRMKHLIKLPNGEFLVPEKIETAYHRSSFVEQIYVHGESTRSDLVAIIVPQKEFLLKFAAEEWDLKGMAVIKLCMNKVVRKHILENLHEVGKKRGLMPFEQVKRIYLADEEFTIDNDLLTPTMKNKRAQIHNRYADVITWMHAKIERDRLSGKKLL